MPLPAHLVDNTGLVLPPGGAGQPGRQGDDAVKVALWERMLRALASLIVQCDPGDKVLFIDSCEQLDAAELVADRPSVSHRTTGPAESWLTRRLLPTLTQAGLRMVVAGWNQVDTPVMARSAQLGGWPAHESREYLATRGLVDRPPGQIREFDQT